jgi:hypothetical protein
MGRLARMPPMPTGRPLRKLWSLPRADKMLIAEAVFYLAFAAVAISFLSFERLGRLASFPVRRPPPLTATRQQEGKRIRWATRACGGRIPWRAMCFEQGLAAQLMLRRRGIPSTLYYGAAPDRARGVVAHVWVRDRNVDVVGCEIAQNFAVLATFPAPGRDPDGWCGM